MEAEAKKVENAGEAAAAESLKKSADAAAGAGNNDKLAVTPTGPHLTRDEAWTAQGSFLPGAENKAKTDAAPSKTELAKKGEVAKPAAEEKKEEVKEEAAPKTEEKAEAAASLVQKGKKKEKKAKKEDDDSSSDDDSSDSDSDDDE